MSKQLSKDTKNIYVYETKNIHLYFLLLGGGGAFIRRLLSLVGLLSRALLSGDLCPGGFCPIPVIVIFPYDHQYFTIILRISDLVNVSGMVGLQKITTDYSSGPLIQCVK